MRGWRGLVLGIAGAVLLAPAAWAAPEDVANKIANNIMSPYCPGVTLTDCPSNAAIFLRQRIVGWAEKG